MVMIRREGTPMSALRPMTESEYAAWLAEAIPAYAADQVASGQWSRADALELSQKGYAELLPQGLATPGHHLFTIVDDQALPVGVLWFAEQARFDSRVAYVYDVSVTRHRRREGHARRAFVALEEKARELGLTGIALHVFGDNFPAQALYARLGFRPTNINLFKRVEDSGA
jgi:ribosomal protein S18 acetylase RimI-like enzyme